MRDQHPTAADLDPAYGGEMAAPRDPADNPRLAALYFINTKRELRHDEDAYNRGVMDAARALCGPVPAPTLDVEALGEAIFRVGTGFRQRDTASIPGRIANSQDGAKASGEFAELVAAEYARLSETRTVTE